MVFKKLGFSKQFSSMDQNCSPHWKIVKKKPSFLKTRKPQTKTACFITKFSF